MFAQQSGEPRPFFEYHSGVQILSRNIAVVGAGHWGKNLIRNFEALDCLAAVCDTDPKALESLRRTHPKLALYEDIDTMLQNPEVSALAISTPPASHYALAKKALQADTDIFVEKPLALSCQQAEELVSLAENRKQILMVGHVLNYHPAVIEMKKMMESGEIGKINYIYSNRLNLGRFRTVENILWSFAPHDISVIIDLLKEMPSAVGSQGGSYIHSDIADVTVSWLDFPSGAKAHIFVSWLHPYKEQRLVIIGDKKMVLFDDVKPRDKLIIYNHEIDWTGRSPSPRPGQGEVRELARAEPLRVECEHFIDCLRTRKAPLTDGREGLRVLSILEACQQSLEERGKAMTIEEKDRKSFIHETSRVDEPSSIGENTKIWHFSHVLKNCTIGRDCVIGQNVSIGPNVSVGNNVKIQNNVSVYEGVRLEDDVFCGPSMVFTNVINPRSHWPRKDEYRPTLVKKGASLGANSTILCGITIGRYAFVGAGALVNKDVPDYALVHGVPARLRGWMCYCGIKINLAVASESSEQTQCSHCRRKYKKEGLTVTELT